MVVNCIRGTFQKKDYIETIQAIEMRLLKALPEENFGHELQQISSFLSTNWDNFKKRPN